eukprot:2044748-Prymnesium_polylepis.1
MHAEPSVTKLRLPLEAKTGTADAGGAGLLGGIGSPLGSSFLGIGGDDDKGAESRGQMFIEVVVTKVARPSWLQVVWLFLRPYLRPLLEFAARWREGCSDAEVTLYFKTSRGMTGYDLQKKTGLKPGHMRPIAEAGGRAGEGEPPKPMLKIAGLGDKGRTFLEAALSPIGGKHDNEWLQEFSLQGYKWFDLTATPLGIYLPIGEAG